jgi:two-component system, NtrC family, response regulator AtoC
MAAMEDVEPTPIAPGGGRPTGRVDLLLVVGDGRMQTCTLAAEIVIGRGAGCDVVIDHVTLSRRHAVVRSGPELTVQDLGSTNGTRVGDVELHGGEPVVLRNGDSFHIGPFTFLPMSRERGDVRSVSGRDVMQVVEPTPAGVPSLVREVAVSTASVLILGETGVGKEVLAETIHGLSRRSGELVRINCAALAGNLLESELFGHEKGAFTGAGAARAGLLESASGGTVFLDEIGELPLDLQAKVLRAVEQREVLRLGAVRPLPIDVRFIAATNRDLLGEVDAGRFRRDLYFRLDGVSLVIPPLRERAHLIGALAVELIAGRARLGADVLAALEAHSWPGNVRELRAVLDRALLLARGRDLQVRHLTFAKDRASSASTVASSGKAFTPAELADRERVQRVLEECAGNQSRAAKVLGVSRTTLVNKINRYRLERPRG